MVDPVPRGIWREGKVSYRIFVDFVIELEEDAQGSPCKDRMGRFREDVIV